MAFKNYGTKKKDELKYEIIEKIGVLDSDSEYPKELRVVKWGNSIKYDIRSWKQNEDGTETPLKGITLDNEELYSLYELLQEMNEDESKLLRNLTVKYGELGDALADFENHQW